MTSYTLYGAEVSYFTGKARAYLDWRGVEYTEKPATQAVYRDVILPNVGWPVIPVATLPDGTVIQDTTDIIGAIEARENAQPPAWPASPLQRFVAELLQLYGDEWLMLPAMHYRWNYNEDWAYSEFGALSAPDQTPEQQYEIGRKNGARFKGALPILGVSADTVPGIEKSYEAFLSEFSAHLDQYPYLLGSRPSLADFAFYGPLYAHLYRDPASGELMHKLAPKVADWVERMKAGGGKGRGELLSDDAVPETLEPILHRQMQEQLPAIMATSALYNDWAANAASGDRVPRALGDITIDIEGHSGPAKARSFPLWRLQAALDVYGSMNEAERARADALLSRVGGEDLKTFCLPARLKRENCQVVLA
ncbi:glutathione S-transferase [Henriciella barbarensis]|uniref:Glutathione S-transferase n=1 Tax=Henriciella barbarensis TaxID=86342 RepID=A0A399R0U8_9PROT|nr:glutathione S-transferase N-terminal domain-containing protein [Henriciella barbarensis]RIJ24553.1 glutathione S-transferase [Henriciella barbarensis]